MDSAVGFSTYLCICMYAYTFKNYKTKIIKEKNAKNLKVGHGQNLW